MRISQVIPGFYKVTDERTGYFANVRRDGRKWHADIRKPSGELARFAGIWNSRRDAMDEVNFILERM